MKIEKSIGVRRLRTLAQPADPEAHEIAKQMKVGDSVLVDSGIDGNSKENIKQRAQRLMRYIGRLHPSTSGGNFEGGAISRADDDGNIRVWRVNYWEEK